jgi:hypothetical protein
MKLKILVSAIGAVGVAWLVAPSVASATGPAAPHAQPVEIVSPVEKAHWVRWPHRHCRWHRHRHWHGTYWHWHRWHWHCWWHWHRRWH